MYTNGENNMKIKNVLVDKRLLRIFFVTSISEEKIVLEQFPGKKVFELVEKDVLEHMDTYYLMFDTLSEAAVTSYYGTRPERLIIPDEPAVEYNTTIDPNVLNPWAERMEQRVDLRAWNNETFAETARAAEAANTHTAFVPTEFLPWNQIQEQMARNLREALENGLATTTEAQITTHVENDVHIEGEEPEIDF
jgi:hypothetical protein